MTFPRSLRTIGASRRLRAGTALAALVLLGGCGSESQQIVEPTPNTGTITVVLTPGSATVAPGSSGSVGLSLTRGGGFAGAVVLTATNVPAGVTVSFGSATVSAGSVSTSVTITVGAGVTPATTAISIVGTSGTLMSPATTLTLRTT
jgi:hypothetical protein